MCTDYERARIRRLQRKPHMNTGPTRPPSPLGEKLPFGTREWWTDHYGHLSHPAFPFTASSSALFPRSLYISLSLFLFFFSFASCSPFFCETIPLHICVNVQLNNRRQWLDRMAFDDFFFFKFSRFGCSRGNRASARRITYPLFALSFLITSKTPGLSSSTVKKVSFCTLVYTRATAREEEELYTTGVSLYWFVIYFFFVLFWANSSAGSDPSSRSENQARRICTILISSIFDSRQKSTAATRIFFSRIYEIEARKNYVRFPGYAVLRINAARRLDAFYIYHLNVRRIPAAIGRM